MPAMLLEIVLVGVVRFPLRSSTSDAEWIMLSSSHIQTLSARVTLLSALQVAQLGTITNLQCEAHGC